MKIEFLHLLNALSVLDAFLVIYLCCAIVKYKLIRNEC
jgi:hypothetical protein